MTTKAIEDAVNLLVDACHKASTAGGWWPPEDVEALRNRTKAGLAIFGLKTALAHSELSEGLEGERKNKMDEHLPHRLSVEVEFGDALIRICDLAGAKGLNLGAAVVEKMLYNSTREDHKLEVRAQQGGKAF